MQQAHRGASGNWPVPALEEKRFTKSDGCREETVAGDGDFNSWRVRWKWRAGLMD